MTGIERYEQRQMLRDPRRSLIIAAALLFAAAVVFCMIWSTEIRGELQEVDNAFLSFMESIRNRPLTLFMKGLAFISSTWINWTVRIVVLAILVKRRQWLNFAAFSLAIVTLRRFTSATPMKVEAKS